MKDDLLTISQAAEYLGVSINTLRRWDESEKLKSIRKQVGGNRYYHRFDLDISQSVLFLQALEWAKAEKATEPVDEFYCPNSAVFQARLNVLEKLLGQMKDLAEVYPLITSMAGEIGSNSFDHNLGNWPDISGIFFGYDLNNRQVVLADRGHGILKTLGRVVPGLAGDAQALEVAFTKTISGRAPESRGNGLKLVRGVIGTNNFDLCFQSGNAQVNLLRNSKELNIKNATAGIRGCIAIIKF
ncbi:hypothetical protein A2482_01990 [Candidatus Falkowbacteria bacterium RIFOXYC2_FULL_48_21]|uniref:HTH merR-type domain-containing protein n=1 Tax=Candidatus Falkowbacteria bacterium RIFOXYC2_FULL_48_21 TaxID=1798005 RepID=A0A1F5T7U9_9BACT|nr:MAG: hypothetical protein A2482_01990 [Candidatus Falkowbacteria bacterium RIFOXYC2_FULL_48_21]